MKGSVLTASALVGGGLLAHVVLDDPGYVAISAGSSLLEPPVPVLLLLLVGLLTASLLYTSPLQELSLALREPTRRGSP